MKKIILTCSLYLATFLISTYLKAEDCVEKGTWISAKDSIENLNKKLPSSCEDIAVDREPIVDMQGIYNNVKYPSLAKKANIEGLVTIKLLLDKEGKIRKYVIVDFANRLLVPAALDALLSVEYQPAIKKNKAIDCWITIPIRFALR